MQDVCREKRVEYEGKRNLGKKMGSRNVRSQSACTFQAEYDSYIAVPTWKSTMLLLYNEDDQFYKEHNTNAPIKGQNDVKLWFQTKWNTGASMTSWKWCKTNNGQNGLGRNSNAPIYIQEKMIDLGTRYNATQMGLLTGSKVCWSLRNQWFVQNWLQTIDQTLCTKRTINYSSRFDAPQTYVSSLLEAVEISFWISHSAITSWRSEMTQNYWLLWGRTQLHPYLVCDGLILFTMNEIGLKRK